jgi:hypothetical protein
MFRMNGFQCFRPFGQRGKWPPIPAPVSAAPSKIPYGGFSPVRLQTGGQGTTFVGKTNLYGPAVEISPARVYSVVGLAPNRHAPGLTPHTRPVVLGSPTSSIVRPAHRLL